MVLMLLNLRCTTSPSPVIRVIRTVSLLTHRVRVERCRRIVDEIVSEHLSPARGSRNKALPNIPDLLVRLIRMRVCVF